MLSEDLIAIADRLDLAFALMCNPRAPLPVGLVFDASANLLKAAEVAQTLEARAAALTTIPHQGKVS